MRLRAAKIVAPCAPKAVLDGRCIRRLTTAAHVSRMPLRRAAAPRPAIQTSYPTFDSAHSYDPPCGKRTQPAQEQLDHIQSLAVRFILNLTEIKTGVRSHLAADHCRRMRSDCVRYVRRGRKIRARIGQSHENRKGQHRCKPLRKSGCGGRNREIDVGRSQFGDAATAISLDIGPSPGISALSKYAPPHTFETLLRALLRKRRPHVVLRVAFEM